MQLLHSQRVVASCCLPLRIFRRTSGTGGFHAPLGAGSAVVSPCRTLLRWGPAMMSCLRVIKSRLGLIFAEKMPERHFEHVGCERKVLMGKDLFSHFYVSSMKTLRLFRIWVWSSASCLGVGWCGVSWVLVSQLREALSGFPLGLIMIHFGKPRISSHQKIAAVPTEFGSPWTFRTIWNLESVKRSRILRTLKSRLIVWFL